MIEGQEGVTWEDWVAIAETCERSGIEALFRSDHYVSGTEESRPVLDYYGPKLVHFIDATQPPHRVLRDILNISDTF